MRFCQSHHRAHRRDLHFGCIEGAAVGALFICFLAFPSPSVAATIGTYCTVTPTQPHSFEADLNGWTAAGTAQEWVRAAPSNKCGDPATAPGGASIVGTDLTATGGGAGCYNASSDQTFTSPAYNCTGVTGVILQYQRELNLQTAYDFAYINVNNGSGWVQVWAGQSVNDTAWYQHTIDISRWADGKSGVQIQFQLTSNASTNDGGWNLDLVEVGSGTPNSTTVSVPSGGVVMGEIGSVVNVDVRTPNASCITGAQFAFSGRTYGSLRLTSAAGGDAPIGWKVDILQYWGSMPDPLAIGTNYVVTTDNGVCPSETVTFPIVIKGWDAVGGDYANIPSAGGDYFINFYELDTDGTLGSDAFPSTLGAVIPVHSLHNASVASPSQGAIGNRVTVSTTVSNRATGSLSSIQVKASNIPAQLTQVGNSGGAPFYNRTLLAANLNASSTTVQVDSAAGFPNPVTLRIDNEELTGCVPDTAPTPDQFMSCTRGANSTTAASHSVQTPAYDKTTTSIASLASSANKTVYFTFDTASTGVVQVTTCAANGADCKGTATSPSTKTNDIVINDLSASLSIDRATVGNNGKVTVTMTLRNNGAVTLGNLSPPASATLAAACNDSPTTEANCALDPGYPSPSSILSLDPGSQAQFTWVYSVTGSTDDTYSFSGYASYTSPGSGNSNTPTSAAGKIAAITITVTPKNIPKDTTPQTFTWTIKNNSADRLDEIYLWCTPNFTVTGVTLTPGAGPPGDPNWTGWAAVDRDCTTGLSDYAVWTTSCSVNNPKGLQAGESLSFDVTYSINYAGMSPPIDSDTLISIPHQVDKTAGGCTQSNMFFPSAEFTITGFNISSLTNSPAGPIPADGQSKYTLTARLMSGSNPVSGAIVNFSATNGALVPPSGTTDANGYATAQLTAPISSSATTSSVTASYQAATKSLTVNFSAVTGIMLNYLGGSLDADLSTAGNQLTVNVGTQPKPSYQIQSKNIGDLAMIVDTNSTLAFTDGTRTTTAYLSTCSTDCQIDPNETATLTFVTYSSISTAFCNGSYLPIVTLKGKKTDQTAAPDQQPTLTDKVTISGASSCSGMQLIYIGGSLSPTAVPAGSAWGPTVTVKNLSAYMGTIQTTNTRITLKDFNGATYSTNISANKDIGSAGSASESVSLTLNSNAATVSASTCNGAATLTLRAAGACLNSSDCPPGGTFDLTPAADDTATVSGGTGCAYPTVTFVGGSLDTTPSDVTKTSSLTAGAIPKLSLQVRNDGNAGFTVQDNPAGVYSLLTITSSNGTTYSTSFLGTVAVSSVAGSNTATLNAFDSNMANLPTGMCNGTANITLNIRGLECPSTGGCTPAGDNVSTLVDQSPTVGDTVSITGGTSCGANSAPQAPSALSSSNPGSISTVTFTGTVTDAVAESPPDTVMLEVEYVLNTASFTNTPTVSSAFVTSGSSTSVSASGLANNTYKWQARATDSDGSSSATWTAGPSTFTVSVANTNPTLSGVAQYKTDGSTTIAVGGTTNEDAVKLQATLSDADSDPVKLEVEAQPAGTGFSDVATASSAQVASGGTVQVQVSSLSNSGYNWQYRAVDSKGGASAWTTYNAASPDFTVSATKPDLVMAAASGTVVSGGGAELGDKVALTFSLATNSYGNASDCTGVLTLPSGKSWGASPSCSWSADGKVLTVTLGTAPSMALGDTIGIASGTCPGSSTTICDSGKTAVASGSPPGISGSFDANVKSIGAVRGTLQGFSSNLWSFCTAAQSNYDSDLGGGAGDTFLGSFILSREGAAGSGDQVYVVNAAGTDLRVTDGSGAIDTRCGGVCGDAVGAAWHWTDESAASCAAAETEAIFFGTTTGRVVQLNSTGTSLSTAAGFPFNSGTECKGTEARTLGAITTGVTGDAQLLYFGANIGGTDYACSLCWATGGTKCVASNCTNGLLTVPRLYDCQTASPTADHTPNTNFTGRVWFAGSAGAGIFTFDSATGGFTDSAINYSVGTDAVYGFPYWLTNGRFYVGSSNAAGTSGAMHIFNKSDFTAPYAWAPAGTGYNTGVVGVKNNQPWVTYGGIFFGDEGGKLHCVVESTGVACTGFPLQPDGTNAIRSQPIVQKGVLYFSNTAGKIYAYDITDTCCTLKSPVQLTSNGYPYNLGVSLAGNIVPSYDYNQLIIGGSGGNLWYLPMWTTDPTP